MRLLLVTMRVFYHEAIVHCEDIVHHDWHEAVVVCHEAIVVYHEAIAVYHDAIV